MDAMAATERLAFARATVEQTVRAALGPAARLVDWTVEPVAYIATTPSTAALQRVTVRLISATDENRTLFVKTIHSLRHSHLFLVIPEGQREAAVAGFPWRVEADVFASGALNRLPPGLRAPDVYLVEDLGEDTLRIWMEDVQTVDTTWDLPQYSAAARALGRLAGSGLRHDGGQDPFMRSYFESRMLNQAIPALRDPATWAHPLVAPAADSHLQSDLLALAKRTPAILASLDALPAAFAHGDACPQNLLAAGNSDGFVAIDWGMAGTRPVGHDLSQLIAGRAEAGHLDGDDLPRVDRCIVDNFLEGLHEMASDVSEVHVRAGYVGSLVVRSAFTCVPVEYLESEPTPELSKLFHRRLAFGRFVINLAATVFPNP